ncbi:unnamed protein product [Trifolium pratense]|uniref:Uncharacterized protein n=1 Tax=Trifolium pratense TaxID=57577 RepID=A0ACB0K201_TRIPR|nr:unnamed protein product [Trifolium pratense]
MGFKTSINEFVFSILILLIIPTLIAAECTCDEDRNKAKALVYIPLLGKMITAALNPEIIKAFAAGVILSTTFIHVPFTEALARLTTQDEFDYNCPGLADQNPDELEESGVPWLYASISESDIEEWPKLTEYFRRYGELENED